MPHAQQQILDAVKAALDTGAIVPVGHVFLDRTDPLGSGELPAILVGEDDGGEQVEPRTVHGLQQRDLAVMVAPVVAATTGAAAQVRELGLKVERVLAAPGAAIAALCKAGVRLDSSRQVNSGEGENTTAARVQTWRMNYLVRAHTPDLIS